MLWIILAALTVTLFIVAMVLFESETRKHEVKGLIVLSAGLILFVIQAIWGPK